MLFAALVETFRKKDTDVLIVLAFIMIACESVPKLPAKFIESKTGVELSAGMSSLAWVAIGLQENDGRANGWYNDFLLSPYFGAGKDKARQSGIAMREILNRFDYFSENELQAVDFFHFFWEAKGQYTLPYFILLLPFTAQGMAFVYDLFTGEGALKEKITWKTFVPVIIVMIVVVLSTNNKYLRAMFRQDMDTQEYRSFVISYQNND